MGRRGRGGVVLDVDGDIRKYEAELAKIPGVTEKEAHLYCTIAGDLRNGAVWGMGGPHHFPVVVGLEVPLVDRQRSRD